MIAATAVVAVMPVVVVWLLRANHVVSSPWVCVGIAVVLAVSAASAGSALWKRRPESGDMMFSELMLWGWLRRRRIERRFGDAVGVLEIAEADRPAGDGATPDQRWQALGTLAMVVEALDAYTIGHSRRVARHATRVAEQMGLSAQEVRRIKAAAAVHDVGKVFTPREILNKPGALTDEEYATVKQHCENGASLVATLGDPELTEIVRCHHERLDGTGYPAGLTGDAIPLGARIVAVADTYDAIIEVRPYRRPSSHKRAIDTLLAEQGSHLDADVVQAFLSGYAGRRMLVLWTLLAVLPQRAFSFGAAGGAAAPPKSAGQRGTTVAVGAALVAAAFALGQSRRVPLVHHARPAPTRFVARRPDRIRPSRRPAPHARPVSSTCLAYNPELCSVIASGKGARAGIAATTGTLPFTGLDTGLLAGLGAGLIGTGVAVRLGGRGGTTPTR